MLTKDTPYLIHWLWLSFLSNFSKGNWHGLCWHDDVIKWKHFPHYWPFVREIHRSPVNSLHKGQWHGTLMFSLICAWINDWVNNCEAGDLRCHGAHYEVTVMNLIFEEDKNVLCTHLKHHECWWSGCAKGHGTCCYGVAQIHHSVMAS